VLEFQKLEQKLSSMVEKFVSKEMYEDTKEVN